MSCGNSLRAVCSLIILLLSASLARAGGVVQNVYVNPAPSAPAAGVHTTLTFRWLSPLESAPAPADDEFVVSGSSSGRHSGTLQFARDGETVIFTPDHGFTPDEEVTVRFQGDALRPPFSYHFRTNPLILRQAQRDRLAAEVFAQRYGGDPAALLAATPATDGEILFGNELDEVVLPPDFPDFSFTSYGFEPAPGVIFTNFLYRNLQDDDIRSFNVIFDNDGNVRYYMCYHGYFLQDFAPHPAQNRISHFRFPTRLWYIMDGSDFCMVDTVAAGNGYDGDLHELLITEEGGYYLIAQEWREMDLSDIGGNDEALVMGMVIQQLDADHNVLFEWLSLDHIPVADTNMDHVDITADIVDYMHSNSIEIDTDGNILISSRHIDEVTKIDHTTGEVLWRMGGGSGNQFTFINDLEHEAFYQQHDARRLTNGHISVFDNGQFHDPPTSYVKEYEVDEETLTATLVWSYVQDPPTYSAMMASAREMENGNRVIGWGYPDADSPIASEITADGELVWELSAPDIDDIRWYTYRTYKAAMNVQPVAPRVVETETDTSVLLHMNHFGVMEVQSYHVYLDINDPPTNHYMETDSPVLTLEDLTGGAHYYVGVKSENSNGQLSPMSNVVHFDFPMRVDEYGDPLPVSPIIAEVYPNPFNASTRVRLQLQANRLIQARVFNMLGREVGVLYSGWLTQGTHSLMFDGQHLASGRYFLQLQAEGQVVQTHSLMLLK